ncbi:hypothetical protein HanHA300_Chr05g0193581 [Helianthus annuus]|nr:hypothetical protein HanHA300_Chr05g0193581 [Helianthus annuus]KAJ0586127.1 hypothetical protein HanHA89_Chr05g0208401 [Helianthus annuus]
MFWLKGVLFLALCVLCNVLLYIVLSWLYYCCWACGSHLGLPPIWFWGFKTLTAHFYLSLFLSSFPSSGNQRYVFVCSRCLCLLDWVFLMVAIIGSCLFAVVVFRCLLWYFYGCFWLPLVVS